MREIFRSDPKFFENTFDAFTMCDESLTFSGNYEGKSLFWVAAMAPRPTDLGNLHPCRVVNDYASGAIVNDQNPVFYSRFWHGAGSIFVITTSYLGLSGFRTLYFVLIILSLAFFLNSKEKEKSGLVLKFFLVSVLIGSNFLKFMENYVHIFPILFSFVAARLILNANQNRKKIILITSGMWINFITLFTSPMLYAGITIFAYVLPKLKFGSLATFKAYLSGLTIWSIGFFGSWMSKWLLAEFAGQRGEIATAISSGVTRLNGEVPYDNSSLFSPIALNYQHFITQPLNSLIILGTGVCLIFFISIALYEKNIMKIAPLLTFVTVQTAAIFGWYLVFRNHSIIHYWYTYMSISLIQASLLSLIIYLLLNETQNRNKRIFKLAQLRNINFLK